MPAPAGTPAPSRILTYGRMIKFSHSVFALPFALASFFLAARSGGIEPKRLFWVVIAMIGARSAAMGFNRWVDAEIDAKNPRTAGREIPTGVLSKGQVLAFVVASGVALVAASSQLNPLCFALSPVALFIIMGYSLTKRVTMFSHAVLGLSLAIAPVGAWLAVRGEFGAPAVILGLAVLFWVAGFDILYACQDVEFDRSTGLHSVPARLGMGAALVVARAAHLLALACLLLLPAFEPLHHASYFAGLTLVGALFAYEHSTHKITFS